MNIERIFLWGFGAVFIGGATLISAQAMLSKPYDGIAQVAFEAEDYDEALALWTLDAEHGDVNAHLRIAMMHEKGLGVIEDLALAAEHFRIAAELGDPIGQTRLGVMYETGLGVDRDTREAADWLTLAAEQGLLEAQTRLAALYGSGPLAMRRPDLALQWYEAAAEQGDLKSQVNAGIIHNSGPRGVERNPQAELGSSAAQYSLATLLENRTAPSKDNIEAYAWYRVAMAQGHSRARCRVTSLENRLSPQDLVVAQTMAEQFWESFAAPFRDAD